MLADPLAIRSLKYLDSDFLACNWVRLLIFTLIELFFLLEPRLPLLQNLWLWVGQETQFHMWVTEGHGKWATVACLPALRPDLSYKDFWLKVTMPCQMMHHLQKETLSSCCSSCCSTFCQASSISLSCDTTFRHYSYEHALSLLFL